MLTGYPDRDPVFVYGAYTDYVSPWALVCYLVAALCYRRRTGKGVYLDHSQYEAALAFLSPAILDYIVNGRIMNRLANRDPGAAPHGAYPCKGEDRWVAIAVTTDEEWENFCEVIGRPEWTRTPKFVTLADRKENEDELDRLIGEWTIHYKAEEIMTWMQAKSVAAGIVQTMEDLHNYDLQLKHRNFFVPLQHTEMGTHSYYNEAAHFSKTPVRLTKAAPCLGEDNTFVFKEVLGLTDDDIADLLIKGVITTEYDVPAIASTY
jgi:benzylsuccinate CoA-transferase BbsF subunit